MKVIKITHPEEDYGYYLDQDNIKNIMGEIEAMFSEGEIGEKLQLELVDLDMNKEQFDNLPEFAGW